MINLTAEINVLNGEQITDATINEADSDKSNVSCKFNEILNTSRLGKDIFFLGYSVLGANHLYCDQVNYYISGRASETNLSFAQPYIITISNYSLDYLTIVFDTYNKEHPTSLTANGKTYKVEHPVIMLSEIPTTSDNKITINITNWNKANRPMTIQGIYSEIKISVNDSNILSAERSTFDRSDANMPSYGIISNGGSLSFLDPNKQVLGYIESNLIQDNLNCKMYLTDSISKKSLQIAQFYTSNWNYDSLNHAVNVELKDNLEDLQQIFFDQQIEANLTFQDYLAKCITVLQENGFQVENHSTYNITYDYSFVENTSLWAFLQQLSEVAGLHIYQDNNGVIQITEAK